MCSLTKYTQRSKKEKQNNNNTEVVGNKAAAAATTTTADTYVLSLLRTFIEYEKVFSCYHFYHITMGIENTQKKISLSLNDNTNIRSMATSGFTSIW